MQIEVKHSLSFDTDWDIPSVRKAIAGAKRIALMAHTNADGDAVGSVTGLTAILRRVCDAEVTPMLPDGVPDDYAWLPNADAIVSGRDDLDLCRRKLAECDLAIVVDLNDMDRTGVLADALRATKARRMMIDHHMDPHREGFDIVVSEPDLSSACELVYWLTRETFGGDALSAEAATSLYTGICTDTGTFSYSNKRPSVYMAAADLLAYGIDPHDINQRIKNVFGTDRLRFFGWAIAHRLTVYDGNQVAMMTLTAKDMADNHVTSHELTGLINEVMRLKAVDCGILIREEEGSVRLSLRSKKRYDVNELARRMFDGGGHTKAAGATSHLSLDETVEKVKRTLDLQ